jgi:hypothetical protein
VTGSSISSAGIQTSSKEDNMREVLTTMVVIDTDMETMLLLVGMVRLTISVLPGYVKITIVVQLVWLLPM